MGTLLPTLCCWGSTTATPGQSSKGSQPHRSSFSRKHQGNPSMREMCRRYPAGRCAEHSHHKGDVQVFYTMGHRESENVLRRCSATNQSTGTRVGLQKTHLSNKIPQLLLELPGGSLGAEAAAESLCQELPLLPQPSLGTRAPQTFTTTCSHCSVSSAELQSLNEKPGMQRWHFLLQWRPAKPGGSNSLPQCIVCWALVMLLDMHIKKLEFLHGYFFELTGV